MLPAPTIKNHSPETSLFDAQNASPSRENVINNSALKRLNPYQSAFNEASAGTSRKRRRTYYSYTGNNTIARHSQHPHDEGIRPIHPDFQQWHQVIKDHAFRRMQIFYYQLLFYFHEGCQVVQGRTISQHGRSSCSCCSAAHSAILPNLKDEKGLLTQDHCLYHNMNSTIEMPDIVNQCDCVIENQMRSIALNYINIVSQKGVHPYKALEAFAEEFFNFFDSCRKEIEYRLGMLERIEHLEERITKLESQNVTQPLAWIREYAKAVYDLKECRDAFQVRKQYSLPISLKRYDQARRDIFLSIWGSCPNDRKHLENITTHKQLSQYLQKRKGVPAPKGRSLVQKKKQVMEYIAKFHPIDIWLRSDINASELLERVKPGLQLLTPIDHSAIQTARERLRDSSIVLELQAKGSVCPPYKYLSGKKIDGVRQAYTTAQLMKQKIILQNAITEVVD